MLGTVEGAAAAQQESSGMLNESVCTGATSYGLGNCFFDLMAPLDAVLALRAPSVMT